MESKEKTSLRLRADKVKEFRCKNLIAVIEDPKDFKNIGTVVRNVNALGVEKVYVVDPNNILPEDWADMRERPSLSKTSASAIKWSFVKTFPDTMSCIKHLEANNFVSMVTSPHIKGKSNVVLHEGDFTQKKLAVWFGSETRGISDVAVENSIQCINIEMHGIIESFNLGTASGIVLYEVTRQRRAFEANRVRRNRKADSAVE